MQAAGAFSFYSFDIFSPNLGALTPAVQFLWLFINYRWEFPIHSHIKGRGAGMGIQGWKIYRKSIFIENVSQYLNAGAFYGPLHQIDPKIGLEGENINICVFKEGMSKILIFGKMRQNFEKWQKWLRVGFNMVTILPKMKIFKIPSSKTQILIFLPPNKIWCQSDHPSKIAPACKTSWFFKPKIEKMARNEV